MEEELQGVKVLVIDDSKTIRRSAENLLSKAGHDVITATDGFDALAKIAKQLTGRPSWEVPRKVSYFDRPLTQQHGDLTGKGTIRRSVLRDKMGQ